MTDAKYRTILKRFLPVGVNPEPFWYPNSGAIHRSPVRFRNPQIFTVWLLLHCCRANYSRNVKIIHNCITRGRVPDDGRPSPKFLTPSADHLRPRPATTTRPRSQQSSASSNDGANSTKLRDVVDFWQRFKTFTSRRSFAQKQGRAQSSENRWSHGLSGNAPQTGFRRGFDRSTDRPRKRPSSRPSFFCSFFFPSFSATFAAAATERESMLGNPLQGTTGPCLTTRWTTTRNTVPLIVELLAGE